MSDMIALAAVATNLPFVGDFDLITWSSDSRIV